MLEFQVVPEKSLINGSLQLILGMSLNQIIQALQHKYQDIRKIELSYSDKSPLTGDITLFLKEDGIRLVFDPMTQRLKLIEITDLSKVTLRYLKTVFCSKEVKPTRSRINDVFGATHPGEYDADDQMFHLKFRGLCFSFANDPQSPSNANTVWTNEESRFSTVSKMAIYTGTCHKNSTTPPLPLSSMENSVFLTNLKVVRDNNQNLGKGRTRGVEAQIICRSPTDRGNSPCEQMNHTREILFGDTVSDVVSAIGSPSKVFYKEEDKMRIHAPNPAEEGEESRSDYFYNYFTLGLDILFDAKRHTVKKIILHTNFPGHYDFNCYQRCNFSMTLPSLEAGDESLAVTTFSKWDDISSRLVSEEEKPVILTRGNATTSPNPFGSTYCYGCCGDIIIEVITSNQHIASVTLFDYTFPS